MNRQVRALGNSAGNINNYFTTAYKSKQTRFYDTMQGMMTQEQRNFNTGVPRKTDRELDFSIDGVGFFEVLLPDGSYAYTRDGSFKLGPNGELLSPQGYPLSNTSAKEVESRKISYEELSNGKIEALDLGLSAETIRVPTGASVVLQPDGQIETEDGTILGRINVVAFPNVDALQEAGNGIFVATENSGRPEELTLGDLNGQTKVKQGHLEASNTSIIENMNRVVELNTAVKAQMKVIKLLDQMQEGLNSTITRNL